MVLDLAADSTITSVCTISLCDYRPPEKSAVDARRSAIRAAPWHDVASGLVGGEPRRRWVVHGGASAERTRYTVALACSEQHGCDAPTRITGRWQGCTSFQKAPKLEVSRVCPRDVARRRRRASTSGGTAYGRTLSSAAHKTPRSSGGVAVRRWLTASAVPWWTASRCLPAVPPSAQTHVDGEHAFESVPALWLAGHYRGIAPTHDP